MGKKKTISSKSITQLFDKYSDLIHTGTEILEQRSNFKVISVSPCIDIALGGGIREGSWLTLTGDPKSGKTTTAMQIAANCQKEGRKVIYLDVEGRLKGMNFEVPDLDPAMMTVVAPENEPIPAEKFLDVAYKMMTHKDYQGAVLIIDSISSLMPEKELDGDFSPTRAGLPKILSIFTKKIGQLLPRQRGLVIAITHYIANTAGYGKAKMSDGGNKIQYQADTRMEIAGGEKISAVKPWLNAAKTERVGQVVNWKIICSSLGAPGGQVQSYIRYGKGIDKVQETLILACDLGLIDVSASWYNLSFMSQCKEIAKEVKPDLDVDNEEALSKAFKFQGQEKTYTFLEQAPKAVEYLENAIREML